MILCLCSNRFTDTNLGIAAFVRGSVLLPPAVVLKEALFRSGTCIIGSLDYSLLLVLFLICFLRLIIGEDFYCRISISAIFVMPMTYSVIVIIRHVFFSKDFLSLR